MAIQAGSAAFQPPGEVSPKLSIRYETRTHTRLNKVRDYDPAKEHGGVDQARDENTHAAEQSPGP